MIKTILAISKRFTPPITDLQDGRIIDDNGSEEDAAMPISHETVFDVREEELQYYQNVFPHLKATDLLFYLYPVVHLSTTSDSPDYVEPFFSALDLNWPNVLCSINDEEASNILGMIQGIALARPDLITLTDFTFFNPTPPEEEYYKSP